MISNRKERIIDFIDNGFHREEIISEDLVFVRSQEASPGTGGSLEFSINITDPR